MHICMSAVVLGLIKVLGSKSYGKRRDFPKTYSNFLGTSPWNSAVANVQLLVVFIRFCFNRSNSCQLPASPEMALAGNYVSCHSHSSSPVLLTDSSSRTSSFQKAVRQGKKATLETEREPVMPSSSSGNLWLQNLIHFTVDDNHLLFVGIKTKNTLDFRIAREVSPVTTL